MPDTQQISRRLRRLVNQAVVSGPNAQILCDAANEIENMQKRLDRWEPKICTASAHGLSQLILDQK